jgi:hypothetical protein
VLRLALTLALTISLPAFAAEDDEEGFRMNDVAGTAYLPEGYKSESWADWELKAKSSKGVLFKLWLTPYEHSVTDDVVEAFAETYKAQLESEGIKGVQMVSSEIQERGGRRVGMVELSLKVSGGKGVAYYAFAPSQGQTVHLRTITGSRQARHAKADLDSLLNTLKLDLEGLATDTCAVSTAGGFGATLPAGWRIPVGKELDPVREITGKVGEAELSDDQCWSAIRPVVGQVPDVMFACRMALHIGPLDEYSLSGIEAELNDKFFGRAATPVDAGTAVDVGDRMGIYFKPPVAGGPVRLALAPFEGSMMQMWALGSTLDADTLDTDVQSALATTTFTGPDSGAPIIGFDKRVAHYLKYRPTSPLVLGPGLLLLGLIGGGVTAARRRKPSYEVD